MSRAAKGALALGAAVALWRTADLFLFTDVPTGFGAGGAAWRYAAMGLGARAARALPRAVPKQKMAQPDQRLIRPKHILNPISHIRSHLSHDSNNDSFSIK